MKSTREGPNLTTLVSNGGRSPNLTEVESAGQIWRSNPLKIQLLHWIFSTEFLALDF